MLMIALYVVLFFLAIYVGLYFYTTRKFDHWKKKGIPFKKPSPFFGNLTDFFRYRRSFISIITDIYHECKTGYMGFFLMDEPLLMIKDTELIKNVLVKDFEHFYDRNIENNTHDDPVGGNMLFMIKNPVWKDVRKRLTPIFTSGKVKMMYQFTAESGKEMVQYMKKKVPKTGGVVEAKDVSAMYSTENIVSVAFGIKPNCFTEDSEFRNISKRMFDFNDLWLAFSQTCWFIAPTLVKLFNLKFIDDYCSKFLTSAIQDSIESREKSQIPRNDLIDILIEMKKEKVLEYDIIVGQGYQFFTAGYETTATTISFVLYMLANNKDAQDKLRKEVIDECSKHNGEVTYDGVKEMTYLDMVVKETQRLHPVVPFLIRKCNKDYQIPGTNDVIEKGTGIYISTLGLHRDPKYFPDPMKFDPERFSEENFSKLPQMCFLPFGEGPRNCIGMRFGLMSTKSAVANLVKNFYLDTCPQTHKDIVPHKVGHNYAPIDNQLLIKFTPID